MTAQTGSSGGGSGPSVIVNDEAFLQSDPSVLVHGGADVYAADSADRYRGGNLPLIVEEDEAKMLHIIFEYKDAYSNWEWRKQECYMSSVEECKRAYGLGAVCEYRIVSVEEA